MIERILVVALVILLVLLFLAPWESLRWWARRPDTPTLAALAYSGESSAPLAAADAELFIMYLSGIASVDGVSGSRREAATLEAIRERLPGAVIAADVFPYSVENRGLTQRATTWFWGRLHKWRRVPVASIVSRLISVRNALRVGVSADPRYGPTFNLAVAQEITASLSRHGYDWSRRAPVAVIAYSGGGQIAVGASWFLSALDIPTSVVSIGGVLSSDPAIDRVQHLWHFYGSKDRLHLLGPLLFPSRWPIFPGSAWNRALKEGRLTTRRIGPMRHLGGHDYFDRHARTGEGLTYRDVTVEAVVGALQRLLPG